MFNCFHQKTEPGTVKRFWEGHAQGIEIWASVSCSYPWLLMKRYLQEVPCNPIAAPLTAKHPVSALCHSIEEAHWRPVPQLQHPWGRWREAIATWPVSDWLIASFTDFSPLSLNREYPSTHYRGGIFVLGVAGAMTGLPLSLFPFLEKLGWSLGVLQFSKKRI